MGNTKSILRRIGTEDHRQELESERLKQNYEQIRINDDKQEDVAYAPINIFRLVKQSIKFFNITYNFCTYFSFVWNNFKHILKRIFLIG